MNKNQLQKRNDQSLGYGDNVFFCLLQTWLHWIKGTFFFLFKNGIFLYFFIHKGYMYFQSLHAVKNSTDISLLD